MKAIILAAGRGSRLGDLTKDKPKCMVPFKGKPLLEHQIEALRQAGVTEIGLCTGYRREAIAHYADAEFHNELWESTNMVASLSKAAAWLAAEPCIVSYSDIFYPQHLVQDMWNTKGDIVVAYDPNAWELWAKRMPDPLADMETFQLKPDGTLFNICAKPKSRTEIEGQYMGLLKYTPEGWSRWQTYVGPNVKISMTEVLANMIAAGEKIHTTPLRNGSWGEVDTPEDIRAYEEIS